MFHMIAPYPIEDIMANPDAYIPDDGTIALFEFTTTTGPVVVALGYDDYSCLYYFVKTYPSFTHTVRCDKDELNKVYTDIINDFLND